MQHRFAASITRTLAALSLAAGLAGCSASSDYMHPVGPPQLAAKADAATVVFIRPSGYAAAIGTTILDDKGRFLGDSLAETYFVSQVPAGEHTFIAWAENTAALKAQLAPGKVYYVEVSPKMGALSARVHLLALTSRSESWGELQGWLADSQAMQVDERAGQAYLAERAEDVQERIRRAREALTEYDAEELAERTLRPEDGQ
jgi:hypothetical protein